ncbi:hypothetical protein ABW19_dt0201880 [Dactylella cylindrospora]|nr:hypothetical protein ABW19_dt0201880 [Dactylella cylindrospora]
MATDFENTRRQPLSQPFASRKPIVVGIYGIPGSGKTFLLSELEQELGKEHFEFYEGSKVISDLVPGGLDKFKKLDEQEKTRWRQLAIDSIQKNCIEKERVGVVAGHFMFWPEENETGQPVYTQNDLDTFTHILYLDVPAKLVAQRCLDDKNRNRPSLSVNHLRNWQQAEKTQLRSLCYQHGILFSLISPHPTLSNKVSDLIRDFQHHTEGSNLVRAQSRMDEIIAADQERLETMLVLDADRTLTNKDSGKVFWNLVSTSQQSKEKEHVLKALFSSQLGYSYTAFRQAVLLYEETSEDPEFDALCKEVALKIAIYPEFLSLLRRVAEQKHVGAVILTCGLRRIWDKVLEREGLSDKIKVIGGGRITDGFVVNAEVKAAIVTRLKETHHMYVFAFGDSVLDLPMLREADEAIVIVGDEKTRSKAMDEALLDAIGNGHLSARQALLPSNVSPRLDTTKLPLLQLTDPEFIDSATRRRSRDPLQILHATEKTAAKLLMTPMRDARVAGPALREAHRRVGWYLATEFLTDIIGLEEYEIPHVQGNQTTGYRLRYEKTTCIVALMRGGEPMAFGVNDALPCAMFVHAKDPEDIKPQHLHGLHTIVLVDSVVNSGKTVVEFVQHVRGLHPSIHIVVVAGVVQAQSVSEGGVVRAAARNGNFSLVALRLSDNKYTGKGTTDTGNRIFNTTHLP